MSTAKRQQSQALIRQGAESWQCWREAPGPIEASEWELAREAPSADSLIEINCIFILPAKTVCSQLIWVPTAEESLVVESAQLQMEVSGLCNSQTDPMQLDFETVHKEEDRTLVRGLVFPNDYVVPLRSDYRAFVPSPLALALPSNALCLWREGNSLVACVTGEAVAMVWESTPLPDGAAALGGWLEIFLLEFRAMEPLVEPEQLCDFAEVIDSPDFLGLPVLKMEMPPPQLPPKIPAWSPPAIQQERLRSQTRRYWTRALAATAAALMIMVLVLGAYLFSRELQLRALRAQVEALNVEVEPLIGIARQWDLLAPSIEPDAFALEKLLLAVMALPADGVRLSLFEALPETVRIEGDARNVGIATLYFNSLQAQEGAAEFSWSMPSPVLQPDNSARFAIDGTRLP